MKSQKSQVIPEIEQKISTLIKKMSLLEKVGQLTQLGTSIVGGFDWEAFFVNPDPEKIKGVQREYREDWIREGAVGSYLGVEGAEEINRLQKIAIEESRLGIPLIFGLDVIHGYRTMFPIPLAESCSWEPEIARRAAEVAAREASAAGIHWTFAPMVDIARDARWGRIAEGSGEDPFLGSAFAKARVRGFQGDSYDDPDHIAACAKHYIGYGGALAGRDYNTVEMSEQTLHEIYLKPFKAALEEGVLTFMSSFNDLNGEPVTGSKALIRELLKEKLGFDGFVVSDSNSIGELIPHGFAADRSEAGKKALLAGVDMDMVTESYRFDIPLLVEAGIVPIEVVDEAVRRILRVKFLLGLFDNPYRSTAKKEADTILRSDHLEIARDAARRSIVLLKNENSCLPISKNKNIAIIGAMADSPNDMMGSWAFTGYPSDVVTILKGLKAQATGTVTYSKGCTVEGEDAPDFSEAIAKAQAADVVVAVVGETPAMSGEAASRSDLGLPGNQLDLLKALHQTGKPVVAVLVNGRPLSIPWLEANLPAIVETWQLGIMAGHAIADVLFGEYNPSGKLVTTFPASVGQAPIYYNEPSTGRPMASFKFTSKYIDGPTLPLYPFGFGKSYTQFQYSDLVIEMGKDEVSVSATLKNTGELYGEEVAQLYVCDLVASRVRPVKELKGFTKIGLKPGESKRLNFTLNHQELGFYDPKMNFVVEPGGFKVWVGPDSSEGVEGEFTL